jgi:hypothetical protein
LRQDPGYYAEMVEEMSYHCTRNTTADNDLLFFPRGINRAIRDSHCNVALDSSVQEWLQKLQELHKDVHHGLLGLDPEACPDIYALDLLQFA